ncbi:hypothetical protein B0H13DRAFT_1879100 [Mycena leptocephala]|nr:hypothetical protein B0H13DRAFT_1879100 [Mycena leptocephala]
MAFADSSGFGFNAALPTELEREIFEYSAFSCPGSIPRLVLVASSGNSHITFTAACQQKQRHQFSPVASASCFWESLIHRLTLPPLCDMGLEVPPLRLISSLPLRRLSANLDRIFRPAGVDFPSPLFNQLTHLNIFGTEITDTWPKNLANLPCLTHLSTYWFYGANPPFRGVLAECKLLTVLVLIFMHEHDRIVAWEDFKCFGDAPRSVLMVVRDYLGDWQMGATGGEDCWIRAEIFIKQRQSGEINAIKARPAKFKLRFAGQAVFDKPNGKSVGST